MWWGSVTQNARRLAGLVGGVVLVLVMAWGVVPLWGMPSVAYGSDGTGVSISIPGEVAPGSDFTATINISQVENFDACNYDVSFDPAVLRLDGVTSGQIGSIVIPIDIWREISPRTYTIFQNVPGFPGVTGSGYLAVMRFHVVASQAVVSNINLSNGALSNNLAERIPATWAGGSVNVVSAGSESPGASSPPASSAPSSSPESETIVVSEAEPVTTSPASSTPPSPPEPGTGVVVSEAEPATTLPASSAPSSPPEPGTAAASETVVSMAPPPPATESGNINWPVIWGAIGGVVVLGLIIFSLVRKRSY